MKKQSSRLPKILVVCGPTATGKSDLAVVLAKKFNGEVVSADSRQVYRGLNLGSGKITAREMKGIPHHLLDIADPRKARYTVEDFKRDGQSAITDILFRGALPIICGGTGFYIDALVDNVSLPTVAPNPRLRAQLSKKSLEYLRARIKKIDPRRARELDPYNKVRLIRAIEIATALGRVPKTKIKQIYRPLFIGLTIDTQALREKIHARLVKRIKAGMILEVARLKASGVSWKRFYDFGLEYRYAALYLQKKLTRDEMMTQLESEIVRYARRQMQWFKRNPRITWYEPASIGKIQTSVAKFLK